MYNNRMKAITTMGGWENKDQHWTLRRHLCTGLHELVVTHMVKRQSMVLGGVEVGEVDDGCPDW
jgi:hypothetical protein